MKSFRQLVSQGRPQSVARGRPSMPAMSGANKTTLVQSFRSLAYKENIPPNMIGTYDRNAPSGAGFEDTKLFTKLIKGKDSRQQDQKKTTQGHFKKRIKINRKFIHDFVDCGTPFRDLKDRLWDKQTTAVAQISCERNQVRPNVGMVDQIVRDRLTDRKVSQYGQSTNTLANAQEAVQRETEAGFGKILQNRSFTCSSIKKKLKERSNDKQTPRFQPDSVLKVQDTDRLERSLIKTMDQVLQRVFIHPSQKFETIGPRKLSRLSLHSCQKTSTLGQMQSTRDIKNRLTLTGRSNNSTRNP